MCSPSFHSTFTGTYPRGTQTLGRGFQQGFIRLCEYRSYYAALNADIVICVPVNGCFLSKDNITTFQDGRSIHTMYLLYFSNPLLQLMQTSAHGVQGSGRAACQCVATGTYHAATREHALGSLPCSTAPILLPWQAIRDCTHF
jgi:hypothetical protein